MRIAFFALLGAICVPVWGSPIVRSDFTAGATLIDFDDLPGGSCNLCGPAVTNQYAGFGVTFYNPAFPMQDTADTNLTPFVPNAQGNILFVNQSGGMQIDVSPFQILFSTPMTMVGFDFGSSDSSFMQLDAYGVDGTLLESLDFVGAPAPIGAAGFVGLAETAGIARLDVSYHPDFNPTLGYNFVIDNLEFQGQVPEPTPFATIAAGLLWTLRRSRKHISGKTLNSRNESAI